MGTTKIEWARKVWNPITGCTKISLGCMNCYAERMARRLAGRCGYPEAPHHFDVTFHPERLDEPLRWKKPSTIFVCSMGDLFHEDIEPFCVARVVNMMDFASHHTYLVLTKRPHMIRGLLPAPPNLWLGVTCENQRCADERIPILLQTPAAHRWVSFEPLLERIDATDALHGYPEMTWAGGIDYITRDSAIDAGHPEWEGAAVETEPEFDQTCPPPDWVVVGAESGPRRRPMQLEWAIDLVRQCREAGVACFVKQVQINGKVSHDPADWPPELRVRELPWVKRDD